MNDLIYRLPRSVKIGAFDIEIEHMSTLIAAERQEFGSFSAIQFKIRIQTADVPPRKVAHTVLHELAHAICRYWDIDVKGAEEEEPVVAKMAYGLAAIWRDNPELMAWINEALTA